MSEQEKHRIEEREDVTYLLDEKDRIIGLVEVGVEPH